MAEKSHLSSRYAVAKHRQWKDITGMLEVTFLFRIDVEVMSNVLIIADTTSQGLCFGLLFVVVCIVCSTFNIHSANVGYNFTATSRRTVNVTSMTKKSTA